MQTSFFKSSWFITEEQIQIMNIIATIVFANIILNSLHLIEDGTQIDYIHKVAYKVAWYWKF